MTIELRHLTFRYAGHEGRGAREREAQAGELFQVESVQCRR